MIKEKDVNVEKIIIKYEDGTEKEITKGAVINMTPSAEDEEITMNFEFANFSGNDLSNLIFGVLEMGMQMGVLGNQEEG